MRIFSSIIDGHDEFYNIFLSSPERMIQSTERHFLTLRRFEIIRNDGDAILIWACCQKVSSGQIRCRNQVKLLFQVQADILAACIYSRARYKRRSISRDVINISTDDLLLMTMSMKWQMMECCYLGRRLKEYSMMKLRLQLVDSGRFSTDVRMCEAAP